MRNVLVRFVIVLLLCSLAQSQTAPVFEITPVESTISYYVKASVKITGTFDKWDANLTFTSPDVTTGVLDIKIQAASVHSGNKGSFGPRRNLFPSHREQRIFTGNAARLSLRHLPNCSPNRAR